MVSHNGVGLRGAIRLLASRTPEAVARTNALAFAVCATPALALAALTIPRVLEGTSGVPAAPLDDSYIHFQFARAFANGEPLCYSPGSPPVAGATSLLWPFLLSIPYALGLREHAIVWASWALGFASLALLAWEARQAAARFCSPLTAWGAAALVYAFGANTWFAASGMEVVPLAWLLLRAVRRASEWVESDGRAPARRELVLIALALPLLRPEGMLGSLLIAAAFALTPADRRRLWAAFPASFCLVPSLVNGLVTGQLSSTTARAKWLPLNPYFDASALVVTMRDYVALLVGTLLDGEIWSALFLPAGSAPVALMSLAALAVAARRRRLWARGAFLLVLGLGILIPGTFDCPLCNRLRYLWPFFPAWLVGAAALAELAGEGVARLLGRRSYLDLAGLPAMLVGGFAGLLGGYLHFSIDDVAASARAIHDQQVSLGLWARDALPRGSRIGVNDAGAVTYFSGHPTFDIVGLTTAGEARYWAAGPGSRFEHYEKLGPARLPTHFIVYPEWFALGDLLGEELTSRYVPGASILGGERMSAHVADYSRLGSGEQPDPEVARGQRVIDALDVADLESEAAHDYALLDAKQRDNVLVSASSRLDGARKGRSVESFRLTLEPGGALILRVAAEAPLELEVTAGRRKFRVGVPASRWHEARLELPPDMARGRAAVDVRSLGETFSALHYFSLAAN